METLVPITIEQILIGQRLKWCKGGKQLDCEVKKFMATPDYVRCDIFENGELEYRELGVHVNDLRAVKHD